MPEVPAIVAELLDGLALDGAACTGSALFDEAAVGQPAEETRARHRRAAALCSTCPVIESCRALAADLEPRDRSGVYAGVLYRHGHRTGHPIVAPPARKGAA